MANKTSGESDRLLTNQEEAENLALPFVKVETYDENEETTMIDVAILLRENKFK